MCCAQVSALTGLRTLSLTLDFWLSRTGPAAWRPLLGLRNLQTVELACCGMCSVQDALASLQAAGVQVRVVDGSYQPDSEGDI